MTATVQGLSLTEKRAFGPLLKLLERPAVRDVLVNGRQKIAEIWVDDGEGLQKLAAPVINSNELREIAVNLITAGGRHIDELEPCANVQLGEGIRVHAVLSPIAISGTAISVRVPNNRSATLMHLLRGGLCDTETAKILFQAVAERKNMLITGATASGKTTLLSALLAEANIKERIISIEDVAEIKLKHPHHISLEARQANTEGIGELSLERLLRESLRMRPDRIVLGECRGPEIATLLSAFNTGHDGGASTLHANSIKDVTARLEALGALAGMTTDALARQAVSAIDLVIHVARLGKRHRITGVGTLTIDTQKQLCIETFSNTQVR